MNKKLLSFLYLNGNVACKQGFPENQDLVLCCHPTSLSCFTLYRDFIFISSFYKDHRDTIMI